MPFFPHSPADQSLAESQLAPGQPLISLAHLETSNAHGALHTQHITLNQGGTTIIPVTHPEANATYGNRVIELQDGWVQQ